MTNGLFIAEGLIAVKDKVSRSFPIAIINVNVSYINLSDGQY